MQKMILLFVSVFLVTGSVFAQDNGTNSMWTRNQMLRASRNYAGGWSYRPNGPSRDRLYTVPALRGVGPGIYNNFGYRGGYGGYGGWRRSKGEVIGDVAMVGVGVVGEILVNKDAQKTVRESNRQDAQIRNRELDIEEADRIRDDSAALEQARWERQQREKTSRSPQPTHTYESPVSYQLSKSRTYVVENHSSCPIIVRQNEVIKANGLEPGTYQTIYFNKDDGELRLQGVRCELSSSFVGDRIVVTDGR